MFLQAHLGSISDDKLAFFMICKGRMPLTVEMYALLLARNGESREFFLHLLLLSCLQLRAFHMSKGLILGLHILTPIRCLGNKPRPLLTSIYPNRRSRVWALWSALPGRRPLSMHRELRVLRCFPATGLQVFDIFRDGWDSRQCLPNEPTSESSF